MRPCRLSLAFTIWPWTWKFALAAIIAAPIGCNSKTAVPTPPEVEIADDASPKTSPPADPLHPVVQLETSAGNMVLRLDAERSPTTVRNFLDYVNDGFYSGTQFHFVDPGRMILGGGYTADGKSKPTRISIRNEAHNGLKNVRGSVAMARSPDQIDSATSQFFINLQDAPELDFAAESPEKYGYCVFGEVIEGLDIAEEISQLPTHDLGGDLYQTPQSPVTIVSARVAERAGE